MVFPEDMEGFESELVTQAAELHSSRAGATLDVDLVLLSAEGRVFTLFPHWTPLIFARPSKASTVLPPMTVMAQLGAPPPPAS